MAETKRLQPRKLHQKIDTKTMPIILIRASQYFFIEAVKPLWFKILKTN